MDEATAVMFTFFRELPMELRLNIWEEYGAASPPRDVHVTFSKPKPGNTRPNLKLLTAGPAILYACSESRKVGLMQYFTSFNTQGSKDEVEKREIYVDPQIDAIIFMVPGWVRQYNWADLGHEATASKVPTATCRWDDTTHRLCLFELYSEGADSVVTTKKGMVVQPRQKARFGTAGDLEKIGMQSASGMLRSDFGPLPVPANDEYEIKDSSKLTIPGNLPLELHDMIEEHAASISPRGAHAVLKNGRRPLRTRLSSKTRFKSWVPVPALLHVCSQSREVGLEKYTMVSNTKGDDGMVTHEIYADPESDIVVFTAQGIFLPWKLFESLDGETPSADSSPWSHVTHSFWKVGSLVTSGAGSRSSPSSCTQTLLRITTGL
ncbi:hypothetical protein JHW43_004684 [Diplocarpon mali]|nr:hypothetical protein JHW43_004684 [Diplocarpon mali]